MTKWGYKLMTEEQGPRDLVRNAVAAEEAGFDFVAASDHFHPWMEVQGHSPLVWPVLGAVAQATRRVGIMTAVTCPILRYHPAIVAQGAATVALLSEDRFTLGLGSGERLNEHVVGGGWPSVGVRLEMMEEAIEIIRRLFKGGVQNFRGVYLELENARLFDLPDQPPPLVLAAGGPQAATLAGETCDGVISTSADREIVEAFRSGNPDGPRYVEVSFCWAESRDQAIDIAYRYNRWGGLGWDVMPELPDPAAFESVAERTSREEIAEHTVCGPDPEPFVEEIEKHLEAGFDHLVLRQMGPEQAGFLDFYTRQLRPRLEELAA